MPSSTTNTETVAPPAGLLAMSWSPGMAVTNTTAAVIAPSYTAPRNVLMILGYRPEAVAEQDTSNTAPEPCHEPYEHTNAGLAALAAFRRRLASRSMGATPSFRARGAIFELRRLSGLTWEELATLLSVTRRSLHLWANGGPINTRNERHLRDLLVTMRELDRGTSRENRALLLAPLRENDMTVGDLLRGRHFRDALALVGRGRGRVVPPAITAAVTGPEKLSVADMLGTSADRLHTDEGRAIPRRRGPRRGV